MREHRGQVGDPRGNLGGGQGPDPIGGIAVGEVDAYGALRIRRLKAETAEAGLAAGQALRRTIGEEGLGPVQPPGRRGRGRQASQIAAPLRGVLGRVLVAQGHAHAQVGVEADGRLETQVRQRRHPAGEVQLQVEIAPQSLGARGLFAGCHVALRNHAWAAHPRRKRRRRPAAGRNRPQELFGKQAVAVRGMALDAEPSNTGTAAWKV